jgi:hypothetical protein
MGAFAFGFMAISTELFPSVIENRKYVVSLLPMLSVVDFTTSDTTLQRMG